jgi:hypothetical protein
MNYKILIGVLKSKRRRGGCDGEKKEVIWLCMLNDLVGVEKKADTPLLFSIDS